MIPNYILQRHVKVWSKIQLTATNKFVLCLHVIALTMFLINYWKSPLLNSLRKTIASNLNLFFNFYKICNIYDTYTCIILLIFNGEYVILIKRDYNYSSCWNYIMWLNVLYKINISLEDIPNILFGIWIFYFHYVLLIYVLTQLNSIFLK